eukprot:TRINITY_DN21347_c0_g1_i3.p2 TRINITY_DN21347_c0_g1~~TRINITY_DN21347_c0_g1_i3.p2  ORF type:complete len:100 (+),score=11.91 TRINITY_DN21347_c0_g1_i3:59-358(+)
MICCLIKLFATACASFTGQISYIVALGPPFQLGTGDELIRTPDVLEFLERQAANISAEVVDFGPSSGHVEHLRTDPARYEEALHGFLKTAHGDLSGSAH